MNNDELISKLWAGTATSEEVMAALGWEIRPNKRTRVGMVCATQRNQISVPSVVYDAESALSLFSNREQAVRLAINLPGEMQRYYHRIGGLGCPVARRLCIVALMHPEMIGKYFSTVDIT